MTHTADSQIAHFKFSYPQTGQAPDALLSRAINDTRAKFLEPNKFQFFAVYDTYPDEDHKPEPGLIDVIVMAQRVPIKVPWYKRVALLGYAPSRHDRNEPTLSL